MKGLPRQFSGEDSGPNARGTGSILGQGTKMPHGEVKNLIKKKKEERNEVMNRIQGGFKKRQTVSRDNVIGGTLSLLDMFDILQSK